MVKGRPPIGSYNSKITAELEFKACNFRECLENWFQNNSRDFPWRHSKNPFHLLVAEILLRKTQAKRVEFIFNKFCASYKNPFDVTKEAPELLYILLDKLGLRKRGDWIIEICNRLVKQYNGELPLDYNELLKLKGVGPYSASMVLLALNHNAPPPIDNNIARLISRVFCLKLVGDNRREKEIGEVLKVVFMKGEPRLIVYAMLDLTCPQ